MKPDIEKTKELNLAIPQSAYQKLKTIAAEKKKAVPEIAVELLQNSLGREIAKAQKEKLTEFLEDFGGERITAK